MTLAWTYNIHEQERDSFKEWLLPSLTAPLRSNFDELSEKTDKFQNVVLTIHVNGIEVSALAMIESLERNWHHHIADEALKLVRSVGMEELQEVLAAAEHAMVQELRTRLKTAGIELPEEERW